MMVVFQGGRKQARHSSAGLAASWQRPHGHGNKRPQGLQFLFAAFKIH